MKTIIDVMGSGNAPISNVWDILVTVRELGVEAILVDRGEGILKVLKESGIDELPPGLEIVHASEAVKTCDNPATAFEEKKDFSLTVSLDLLKNGDGAASISAGSAGVLLSAATLMVKRTQGIRQTAMAPVAPIDSNGAMFINCGATAEDAPKCLLRFALMDSHYAKWMFKCPEPGIGLPNIGTEPFEGIDLQREARALLTETDRVGCIYFAGNVEVRKVAYSEVDVIVSDGCFGGILLKTMEGTGGFIAKRFKIMFKENLFTKLVAMLVSGDLRNFKKMIDAREVGGTLLTSIPKPVIRAHGSSDAFVIRNATCQAQNFAASGITESITEDIGHMRLHSE